MARSATSGVARAETHLVDHADTAHCGVCLVAVASVSHITGLIRQLRDRGWVIATTRQRCSRCVKTTSHFQVVDTAPSTKRTAIPAGVRGRYLASCGNLDAFTKMRSSKLELDHRVPHSEASSDEAGVDDVTVNDRYQPLTPANNQLKRQACKQCRDDMVRPAFMGIEFWVEGSPARPVGCDLCPYANPDVWRNALHDRLR
jgi:hypothetical protein